MKSTIPTTSLGVFQSSQSAFISFIGKVLQQSTYTLTLKGAVDAKLDLGNFGSMTIPGIGFNAQVPIAGLNGLPVANYILSAGILFGSGTQFSIVSIVNIPNPSKLTLTLGNTSFNTTTPDGSVGISSINGLTLAPGNNYFASQSVLDYGTPAGSAFLSNIFAGPVPLTLLAYPGTSSNSALAAGLAPMKTVLTIPQGMQGGSMSATPYTNLGITVLPNTGTDKVLQFTATFQTPFYGIPFTLTSDATGNGGDGLTTVDSAVLPAGTGGLFQFANKLPTTTISGSGQTTVSWLVNLPSNFGNGDTAKWTALVNFAKTNGYIPSILSFYPAITVGGFDTQVSWGSNELGNVHIKTGSDFANILNFLPPA